MGRAAWRECIAFMMSRRVRSALVSARCTYGVALFAASAALAGCAMGVEQASGGDGPSTPKSAPAPATAQQAPVALFNGADLGGWTPFLPGGNPAETWTVAEGVLRCTGEPAGYIATDAMYTSFVLELEWRFDPAKGAGNSGVLLRVQPPDRAWPTSMEAQLMSGRAGDIWNIGDFPMVTDPARTSGRHTAMEGESSERPLGEWNRYRIVVDGPVLELYVNGALKNRATGCRVVPGRIALQSEGAWIEFRSITLTPLPGGG
jgi:hypothetical protein